MNNRRRIIVGISGATGIAYGIRILELLRSADVESHLVVSKAGHLTRSYESGLSARDLESLADVNYAQADIGAAIASGSFRTMGMVVAPCSIRTLAEIASCATGSLLTRAAATQSPCSAYQATVSRSPSSNGTVGRHPSSARILAQLRA